MRSLSVEEIKKKAKQTSLKHYGVDHPQKSLEISLKSARGRNKSVKKTHWKTGKEIICVASYEALTVDYFNTNHIDYIWHGKSFKMNDGRYYMPDCYLPEQNVWIEIKGHFWKDAEEKWNWFHGVQVNSELWNKDKLKSLGIL